MQHLTTEERERLAYAEGYTETAKLLGQLDDVERERDDLTDQLEENPDPEYVPEFLIKVIGVKQTTAVVCRRAIVAALDLLAKGDSDTAQCVLNEVLA